MNKTKNFITALLVGLFANASQAQYILLNPGEQRQVSGNVVICNTAPVATRPAGRQVSYSVECRGLTAFPFEILFDYSESATRAQLDQAARQACEEQANPNSVIQGARAHAYNIQRQ